MKHTLLAVAFALMSFASFAEVKQVDVVAGDKVKIQVLDCKSNEKASFTLNNKSGVVTTSCEKAMCHVTSRSEGQYNVYRFHGEECVWNGCNEKAKRVGAFKADAFLGISSRASLKRAMISYLAKSADCGAIRIFISGSYGYLTVE